MDPQITSAQGNLDQPLGKLTVFRMGALWFVPSSFVAFGAQWAILEPLDFYARIFQPSLLAWLYLAVVSLVLGALTTAVRFVLYYRGVYQLYRKRSHVDNLYADRTTIQGKYASLIEQARRAFTVCGMSLHTLLEDRSNRDLIVRCAQEKAVNFTFVMHAPDCKYLKIRAMDEGKRSHDISNDSERHLANLTKMRGLVLKSGIAKGSISIRTVKDKMPDCFFLLIDDVLYIEPYLQGTTGRDCPVFSLKRNETNERAFSKFLRAIQDKCGVETV